MSERITPERILPRLKLKFKNANVTGTRPPWPNFPVPIAVAFTEDEKICPLLILNGPGKIGEIAKRVTNLNLMKLDSLKSKAAIDFAISLMGHDDKSKAEQIEYIVKTFFDSAVILYSKLFIDSENGKVKLEHKKIYKENNEFIKLHEKIVDIRHKSLAHQTGVYDYSVAFVALNPDVTKKEVVEFYYKYYFFGILEFNELVIFSNMIANLIEEIDKKIFIAEDRMLAELEKKVGIDKLYELSLKIGDESDISGYSKIEEDYSHDNYETYQKFHGK